MATPLLRQVGVRFLPTCASLGEHLGHLDALIMPTRAMHALSAQPGEGVAEIFDRQLKSVHRERAAYLRRDQGEDPLQAEMAERLLDRLQDCKRTFPVAAVLGGAAESVLKRLRGTDAGIEQVYYIDQSPAMLERGRKALQASENEAIKLFCSLREEIPEDLNYGWLQAEDGSQGKSPQVYYAIGDEEMLPLGHKSVDVIISCLGLHWVNDVPGAMTQCRRALKPDGLFLAAMWGGNTLQELRIACMVAEEAIEGGISQRMSPLAQVRDAGNLLTRAGLNIPSVDVDEITVQYKSPDELISHLRRMAETNAVRIRRPRFKKETWAAAQAAYVSTLSDEEKVPDSIPATYEAIYMTGWAPHERQQKALQRGSASASFQDIEKALRQPSPGELGE